MPSLSDNMPHLSNETLIITRKNIKHLYLRIDAEGKLQVSAPKHMPQKDILAFIAKKQQWIAQKQLEQLDRTTDNHCNIFVLFGKQYPIQRKTTTCNVISLNKGICYIESTCKHSTTEAQLIIDYYRKQLRPLLDKWVTHYTPIIGVSPNEICTKNMKTRWGTCNILAKRLWFNVQLARFSEKHIEYVVVHEMVHLLERHHNARFYDLVERAMPDWESYHEALKRSH